MVKVLEVNVNNFGKGGAQVLVWNSYINFDHDKLLVDFYGSDTSDNSFYLNYITAHNGKYYNYGVKAIPHKTVEKR